MKVVNIRTGFANNSSSSHSILLFNKEPSYCDLYADAFIDGSYYYGWDKFVLASPKEKTKYFAAQLAENIRESIGTTFTGLVLNGLMGVQREKFENAIVDHQSVLSFPRDRQGNISVKFVQELFGKLINDPNVVVFGGNDNYGNYDLPRASEAKEHFWIKKLKEVEGKSNKLIAREEPYGWVLFNKDTGAKVRMVRGDQVCLPNTPELVDIKITDKCYKNCAWCYQGSTGKGNHASITTLDLLFHSLAKLDVLEVVLGGGEPTSHPDFAEILKKAHIQGLVPNFTTASEKWLRDKVKLKAVQEYVGSVAYSCNKLPELTFAFREIASAGGTELINKVVIQSVIGVVDPKELEQMINIARELGIRKYSLVGFKSTGRALDNQFKPVSNSNYDLGRIVKDTSGCFFQFYADTSLLNQFPELVQKITCDTKEGMYSMYIDAVENPIIARPSSYIGDKIELNSLYNEDVMGKEIRAVFKQFQTKGCVA